VHQKQQGSENKNNTCIAKRTLIKVINRPFQICLLRLVLALAMVCNPHAYRDQQQADDKENRHNDPYKYSQIGTSCIKND